MRIDSNLKLISKTVKDCAYSKAQCLTFVDEATEKFYFSWIFENIPFYPKLDNLQMLKHYNVVGWMRKLNDDGNIVFDLIDIPDLVDL